MAAVQLYTPTKRNPSPTAHLAHKLRIKASTVVAYIALSLFIVSVVQAWKLTHLQIPSRSNISQVIIDQSNIQQPSPGPPELAPLEPEWEWARNVSIVYTWVNGSVPEYQVLRERYGGKSSVGGSRDRDNMELKYSMRSLINYLPWHTGIIYLVTPGHAPSWLDLSHPRIKLIDQNTLTPKIDQPTFNSNAIEQYLHLIPGLSDQFIVMNDDYFIARPIHPSTFFTLNRGVRLFFEATEVKGRTKQWTDMIQSKSPKAWLGSVYHTIGLLEDAYGVESYAQAPLHFMTHAPFVYHKNAFAGMHHRFVKEFKMASRNKFRKSTDILTPFMHHGYIMQEGRTCCGLDYEVVSANEISESLKFLKFNDILTENQEKIDYVSTHNLKFFNINDEMGKSNGTSPAKLQLLDFFEQRFGNLTSKLELSLKGTSNTTSLSES